MYTLYADDIWYRVYLNIISVAILCPDVQIMANVWYSSDKYTNRPSHGKPTRRRRFPQVLGLHCAAVQWDPRGSAGVVNGWAVGTLVRDGTRHIVYLYKVSTPVMYVVFKTLLSIVIILNPSYTSSKPTYIANSRAPACNIIWGVLDMGGGLLSS